MCVVPIVATSSDCSEGSLNWEGGEAHNIVQPGSLEEAAKPYFGGHSECAVEGWRDTGDGRNLGAARYEGFRGLLHQLV